MEAGKTHAYFQLIQGGGRPSLTSLIDPFCYTMPITSSISHTDLIPEVIGAVDLKGLAYATCFIDFRYVSDHLTGGWL